MYPSEEGRMIILGFADIHGDVSRIDQIFKENGTVDVVLLLGDITHFGRKEAIRQVTDFIKPHCPRILAVPGNCDYLEADDYLKENGLSIHRRYAVLNGIGFVGVGLSLPCPGSTPNEISEHEFGGYLAEAVAEFPLDTPMILVTHEPPFGTLTDLAFTSEHVGSRAVRDFIEKYQPLACFSGHIHEGAGIDHIGQTIVVNPGPLRHGKHVYAEIGDRVDSLEIRSVMPSIQGKRQYGIHS